MELHYWQTTWFIILIAVYTIAGLITAFLCYKESRSKKMSTFEWTIFGYILPIIPLIILKRKSIIN